MATPERRLWHRLLAVSAIVVAALGVRVSAAAVAAPPAATLQQHCEFDQQRAVWEVEWTFEATATDQSLVLLRHVDGFEATVLLTVAAGDQVSRTDLLRNMGAAYTGQFELRDSSDQLIQWWPFLTADCFPRAAFSGPAPVDPARQVTVEETCTLSPGSGTAGPTPGPVRRPGYHLDVHAGTRALAVYHQQLLVRVVEPGTSLMTTVWAELPGEQGEVDNASLLGNLAHVDPGLVILELSGDSDDNTSVTIVEHQGCSGFVPLTPARLMDTRAGEPTIDGLAAGIGLRGAGTVTELQVTGRGGVPPRTAFSPYLSASTQSVWLSVVVTQPTRPGYLTVYPCGTEPPNASNVNVAAGMTVANTVVTRPDPAGRVCFFTSTDAHLVVDVMGFDAHNSSFTAVTPSRLMDTRPGETTVDGVGQRIGKRAAGTTTELWVAGRGGIDSDAIAAAITITVTQPEAHGFLTVWSCEGDPPNVSNVTYAPDSTVASTVVVPLSDRGTVCIYTLATTHIVTDANGFDFASSRFNGVGPVRLLDTRDDGITVDGLDRALGLRTAGSMTEFQVTGRAGVPSGVAAVALSFTVTQTTGPGYLTVWACGIARPSTSNLNYAANSTVSNTVLVRPDAQGRVCVFTLADSHVIADVSGYHAGPA